MTDVDPDFSGFDATLRDGRTVRLRAIQPADEAELLQAFGRLGPDARYMRFMRPVREPNVDRLRNTLAAMPERGIGIVATIPADDGIDIVGGTICILGDDRTTGEFAITVASGFGGTGLARTLLTALIDAARKRGLKRMEGFVLAVNQPMLRLARRMGFEVARDPDDGTIRNCTLDLANP